MRQSPWATFWMRTESGLEGHEASHASALKTWWPGTELNRRRQPFQYFKQLK